MKAPSILLSIFGCMECQHALKPPAFRCSATGDRGGLKSRFLSAMSWNDRRKRIAVIRSQLQERAIALSQELEPAND
jgi:hypothetical protein